MQVRKQMDQESKREIAVDNDNPVFYSSRIMTKNPYSLMTLCVSAQPHPHAARNLAASIESPEPPFFGRHSAKRAAKLLCLALVCGAALNVRATQRYVDVSSSNPHSPFTSWGTAATNIQDAIDIATNGDEVVVNDGVYQVGTRLVDGNGASNRVAITKPLIVRSVNGPDVTTIQGYQVPGTIVGLTAVRCVYVTNGAVLAGFTLTSGATHDKFTSLETPEQLSGGGVWCQSASAVVSNCVLTGNSASWWGGGVYNGTLQNCTLTGNSASSGGGGAAYGALTNCNLTGNSGASYGGAVYYCMVTNCTLANNSGYNGAGAAYSTVVASTVSGNNAGGAGGGANSSTLIDCTITGNTAHGGGGGMNQSTAIHCTFSGNSATAGGGGAGSSTLTRCTLNNNSAMFGGGAYSSSLDNSLVSYNTASSWGGGTSGGSLVNCTVVHNTATTSGGGTAYGTLQNCIIYYNSAPDGNCASSSSLSYCCATPLYGSGTGNFASDPQLDGDFHLQDGSPCVNTGNNSYVSSSVDLDGSTRIVSGTVDLGAFELPSLATRQFRAWLQQYGLPGDGSADFVDSDGDGMNNWQEYIAGTDPTDPTSVLEIVSGPSASSQDITWASVSSRTYSIERSTNLNSLNSFSILQSNIAGVYGTTTFTDTNMTGSRQFYYRVRVEQ